jgi:hypothetical protein
MLCSKCLTKISEGREILVPGEVYRGTGSGDRFLCEKCYKEEKEQKVGWPFVILWFVGILLIAACIIWMPMPIGKRNKKF